MRRKKCSAATVLEAVSVLAVFAFMAAGCAEDISGGDGDDQPEGAVLVVESRDPNAIERPAWIDSDTIIFSWNQDTPSDQLWTVETSGGNPVRFINDNPRPYMHPSYSSGVQMVAFEVVDSELGGSSVDAINLGGTPRTRYSAGDDDSSNAYPCWGPGGRAIGFLQTRKLLAPRFVMIELDKTQDPPRPVGIIEVIDFARGFQHSGTAWYAPAAGAPFSGKVAYSRTPPAALEGTEIYYYDLDMDQETRLTDDNTPDAGANINPSWSPDGAYIVYSSDHRTTSSPEFGRELYIVSVASKAAARLTRTGGNETEPSWSPDGGKIAYVSGGDLYVLTVDSKILPQ